MKIELIDYRSFPNGNRLFLDYLYDYPKVSSYFADAHLDADRFLRRARGLAGGGRAYPLEPIEKEWIAFNQAAGAGRSTLENIRRLSRGGTVAIVTGQQLGLFGGPSYTVYKAATAIRLARFLEESGIPCVPIFWLPSDDSDFEEVRATTLLDRDGGLFDVAFPDGVGSETMAGTVSLKGIESCLDQLRVHHIPGAFGAETVQGLSDAYRSTADFRTAFARWLSHLFQDTGLILFDALTPGYKRHVAGAFATAVQRRPEIVRALRDREKALEDAGYGAQVFADDRESLLFWLNGHSRAKLEWVDGGYRPKGASLPADLSKSLEDEPERLGPNVLLRPLVQDSLFPTVAYVGGPSEVAYFAQIQAISSLWDVAPTVFPRAAFTIVDRKAQRLLERYRLSVDEVVSTPRIEVARKMAAGHDSGEIIAGFVALEREIDERLTALGSRIAEEDPPVADMLEGAGKKILHQVSRVHDRYVKNNEQRNEHLGGHLDYLRSCLLPRGKPQERVLNFNTFLAQQGPGMIEELISAIDPFQRGHRVVYV